MTQGLSPEMERAVADAAAMWPGVELLMLFGSATKSRLGERSDVDLFVRLAPGHSAERADEQRFREQAERACRREVDLVVETPSTSVILRREVAARGRPLFERSPSAATTFRVEAVRAYADLQPQLKKIGAAIRARAQRDGVLAIERIRSRGANHGR